VPPVIDVNAKDRRTLRRLFKEAGIVPQPVASSASGQAGLVGLEKRLSRWVSLVVGLFAFWTMIAYFLPDLSVDAEEPRSSDPLSALFTVENNGNFAVTQLHEAWSIDYLDPSGKILSHGDGVYFEPVKRVESKRKFDLSCDDFLKHDHTYEYMFGVKPPEPSEIKLTVELTYRPSFAPWINRHKLARFHTVQQADLKTRWEPLGG
jgi:hypothetical protein